VIPLKAVLVAIVATKAFEATEFASENISTSSNPSLAKEGINVDE